MDPSVSVILPTYNESDTIAGTIDRVLDALDDFLTTGDYELVIAENGSTDNTESIVEEIAERDDRVWWRSYPREGRGNALSQIIPEVNGETIAYMDVDLATDLRHLEQLIDGVRTEGYDIVTGSRYLANSDAGRKPKRLVASKGFNSLTRVVLRSNLEDHQCGFKAFDRTAILELLPSIRDEHWFWDTELLVKAQDRGYSIEEFGVEWDEKGDSKVDLVRDVLGMGSQLARTVWEIKIRPQITRRRSVGAGLLLMLLSFLLVPYWVDYDELLSTISNADSSLLGISAVIYLSTLVIRGIRYRDILSQLGYDGDVLFLTGAVAISQTANFVVPARAGDAVRAYIVKTRRRIPYTTGFASLTIERICDIALIGVFAGVGAIVIGSSRIQSVVSAVGQPTSELSSAAPVGLFVAAIVTVAVLIVGLLIVVTAQSSVSFSVNLASRLSSDSYVRYVQDVLGGFVGDLQRVGGNWWSIGNLSVSTALIWILDIITGLVVLGAFGVDVLSLELVVISTVAISVATLAKVLPLTPGGVGLYEGVFTFVMSTLAPIPLSLLLGAAIADHAVKNFTTIVVGVLSVLGLNVSLVTAIEESDNIQFNEDSVPKDE